MTMTPRYGIGPLGLAAIGLMSGALIHIAAWIAGPSWVEALGAPPSIVASTAARSWPSLLGTLIIAAMLAGLALCCLMSLRGDKARRVQRGILTAAALFFLARGLLVIPYVFAAQREWYTPIGRFVVTGRWFTAGSMVVLAIGILISLGLVQSRWTRRGIAKLGRS